MGMRITLPEGGEEESEKENGRDGWTDGRAEARETTNTGCESLEKDGEGGTDLGGNSDTGCKIQATNTAKTRGQVVSLVSVTFHGLC